MNEAPPTDPRLVFSQTVEGLVRGLGTQLTPELVSKIREAGIDLSRLEPGYSVPVWVATLKVCAATLYPELTEDQGLRRIGAQVTTGFFQTLIGRALQAVLHAIGPMRALQRVTRSMRSADNFVEGRFTQTGPTSAEIALNDDSGIPEYLAGVFESAGRQIGARDCEVVVSERTPPASVFRVQWR